MNAVIEDVRKSQHRQMVNRKGYSIWTDLSDYQAVSLCLQSGNDLGHKLALEFKHRNGQISSEQLYWIHKIANDSQRAWASASERQQAPVQAAAPQVGQDVFKLFEVAGSKLKYPKVRFVTNRRVIKLQKAGERARVPGSINVTDDAPYGENVWYGRITQDGVFHASRDADPEVVDLVQEFCEDPVKAAREYGQKSGNCCFCAKTLTDVRSVEVGYGPVCADHWGLPWGT